MNGTLTQAETNWLFPGNKFNLYQQSARGMISECFADLATGTVKVQWVVKADGGVSAKCLSSYLFAALCALLHMFGWGLWWLLSPRCDTLKSHITLVAKYIIGSSSHLLWCDCSVARLKTLRRQCDDHKVHESRRDEIFRPRLRWAP